MKRSDYLEEMGIERWQLRSAAADNAENCAVEEDQQAMNDYSQSVVASMDWQSLQQQISHCQRCSLAKSRSHTVFGSGSPRASLMIIGEAPGADEDKQGKPFVGRAGQLLTLILNAIGIARDDVFIANILKCRPPSNRDPQPQEVDCCTPYLQRQIDLIQPKLLLALGRIAAHFLLDSNDSLGKLRHKIHHYGSQRTPLLVTYHPAYLLRSPSQKEKSYQDFRQAHDFLTTTQS